MKLQIQSVIYGNGKESLYRAIKALDNAVKKCKQLFPKLEATLVYGDASPKPVLDENSIFHIKHSILTNVSFKYRFFGFNSGTAKGHNLMGLEIDADYIMIMNPDVIVETQCITRLLKALIDKNAGMVEARQTPLEHAKYYNEMTGETEWASTACTIIKADVFNSMKGFDAETFFLYCDDLDFSWRLRMAGERIYYIPNAIAYHAKVLSVDGAWKPTKAEVYYSAEAALLLAYKWSDDNRAERLYKMFNNSANEDEKKAADEYAKRKRDGRLPVQIDPKHLVGRFDKEDYCDMRYHYA